MRTIIHIKFHRPCPGLESAGQNIPGRILVSVENQAAARATEHTVFEGKGFPVSAARALLASPRRVHFHELDTGAFSLMSKRAQEAGPSGVRDRTGQPVVPQHATNVEAFHSDHSIATYKFERCLVTVFPAQVANPGMTPAEPFDSLAPVSPTALLATHRPAPPSEFGQIGLEEARIRFSAPVTGRQERVQSNIDAYRWQSAGLDLDLTEVAREDDKPLFRFQNECRRLHFALRGAVNFDLDAADMLNAKLIAGQTDAVAVSRKLDTSEASVCLETRVARLIPGFYPPEESTEGLVEPSQRSLGGGEVKASKPGVRPPLRFEPSRLLAIGSRFGFRLPGVASLFQAGVVQTPVGLQHLSEFPLLIVVWKQSVFESAAHLFAFLRFDVPSYCGFRNVSDGASIVASRPESRNPRPKLAELGAHVTTRDTFEAIDNLGNREPGVERDKQVNVVGHYFHRFDRPLVFRCRFVEQLFQALLDRANEHRLAVFRTPYQVNLEREDGPSILLKSGHGSNYTTDDCLNQGSAAIPLPAKAGSPLAT
jgi:hypothetical protein